MYQRMPQLVSMNPVKQAVPRLKIPEAILEGHAEAYMNDGKTIEAQFGTFSYPAPGHSQVKMYYKYGGSHIGTMVDTNRYARMYASENLEFVVNQSIWFEGEAKFADVILPACTNFERWDIGEFANPGGYAEHAFTQCNHRVAVMQHKCIEPLGESKSDFQIFLELAERLGLGNAFSEGSSEIEWCRRLFEATDLPRVTSWKDFIRKGYYVDPAATRRRSATRCRTTGSPRTGSKTCPNSARCPATTRTSGSAACRRRPAAWSSSRRSLKRFDPDDPERPPMMTWRESWEGPHTTGLFEKYPLQLITPHPRFSFHTHHDGKGGALNDVTDHRIEIDGYHYWIARINPADAEARGIKQHDVIRLLQRPGRRALRGRHHRAGAARPGALLRVVGGLRPHGRCPATPTTGAAA